MQTQAVATRVRFEGLRAVAVEYMQGEKKFARALREVVLAAGPIKSPQLLELSGVGDGYRLQKLGIATVHHLPGVGENLSDHLQSRITFEARNANTLNQIMASRWRQYWMGMSYLINRRGLMATPSCTVHASLLQRLAIPVPM
jgi:choline dehydrogenase